MRIQLLLIFSLLSINYQLIAQQDSAILDTTKINVELVEWWNFDTMLIPCGYDYQFSWDHLNVDKPLLSKYDSLNGVKIILGDSSCAYRHPCDGKGEVTSKYGWRRGRIHKGYDIDIETGDLIYAAFDGVVRISKYNPRGYGNYVMIRHYNGLETLYGHLSESFVVPNQTVRHGQIIGFGGNTGRSTGSHLHFETRYKGAAIDPSKIIDFSEKRLATDTLLLEVKDFAPTKSTSTTHRYYGKYHKVRSGDTLWGISRRYRVSVNQICRLNGISSKTILRIGKTLRIR